MTENSHQFPAGTPSPDAWDAAQRAAVAREIALEDEAKAKAAQEQAISDRMASRRAARVEAADEEAAVVDDGVEGVLG